MVVLLGKVLTVRFHYTLCPVMVSRVLKLFQWQCKTKTRGFCFIFTNLHKFFNYQTVNYVKLPGTRDSC